MAAWATGSFPTGAAGGVLVSVLRITKKAAAAMPTPRTRPTHSPEPERFGSAGRATGASAAWTGAGREDVVLGFGFVCGFDSASASALASSDAPSVPSPSPSGSFGGGAIEDVSALRSSTASSLSSELADGASEGRVRAASAA